MRGLPVRLWGCLRERPTEGSPFILKQSAETRPPHSTQCSGELLLVTELASWKQNKTQNSSAARRDTTAVAAVQDLLSKNHLLVSNLAHSPFLLHFEKD